MLKRTVSLLFVMALAVPAVAVAKTIDVQGPLTLNGHGPVRGKLRAAEGPATVRFELTGRIVVAGQADDLEVRCSGPDVKTRTHTSRRSLEMVGCMGRRLVVEVTASRFRFGAKARRYLIEIPAGVSGKIQGRLRERPERPERPAEERPAEERPGDERPAAEAEEAEAA